MFGGEPEHVGVAVPYVTQKEVETAASALADRIAGGFAEFEGVARGNTALRAGCLVSVGLVGEPFDGSYTLTSTRHSYTPQDGYIVLFTVSGRQDRSLFSLRVAATVTAPVDQRCTVSSRHWSRM